MKAISYSDYEKYGCVNCNCETVHNTSGVSGYGATPVKCKSCEERFVILTDGLEQSRIGFGTNEKDEDGNTIYEYPKLSEHPNKYEARKWTYVLPDIRPKNGGEFFASRGVDYDLAGFIKSKQSGERIFNWVREILLTNEPKSHMDYREHSPYRIQFKFSETEFDLDKLHNKVKDAGVLTLTMLNECRVEED